MTVADGAARARALDVRKSFCVTAPAGSGKTELLIQRYLALLSRVERPEQVLAITFTRKAAAEMRERVLQALADASADASVDGEHQAVTRRLANAALERGEQRGWALGRDIGRMNIRTIDGFCAALTRQMPVLSRFGGQAAPVDDAIPLYEEAVADLFAMIDSGRPETGDLRRLLLHFDNNWERLAQLLVVMLAKRDQWQDYIGVRGAPDEAEAQLRRIVAGVIENHLGRLHTLLAPWAAELLALLRYSLGNLEQDAPETFPAPNAASLEDWRSLRRLLLTAGGTFRKKLTRREGFPAGKGDAQAYKNRFTALVGELDGADELLVTLLGIDALPDMGEHADAWQLVLELAHVLPLLSACLLLVFGRHGSVDHTQVALSALDALGDEDAPTELALRLDYVIEHILVDEFQDTAINQYKLVSRLTRGWEEHNAAQPDAPRTVFIVGDGMQSIYGFRNANVGLFLTARQLGFNGVVPEHLALQCNFRSHSGIVEWINRTFRHAFPASDDIRRGRVSFSDAIAVKESNAQDSVALHGFYGEQSDAQEADWVVSRIGHALRESGRPSVAVLGRSRAQLAPVLDRLRRAGISFAADEMDPLAGSPAVADLMTLCRALANPADRVAWFALLRAPWCGLCLADLQRLATHGQGNSNLGGLLLAGRWPDDLTGHGQNALLRVSRCLAWVDAHRDRLALRVWIEQAWSLLGGPESLAERRHLRDAERFLTLLQQADEAGLGLDMAWLERSVDRLYAAGDDPGAQVQVMTLHKAKGLEFDWVFIPSLQRGARSDDRALLLWDETISPEGERGFLLAADDHSDSKAATLYNYLKQQRREKDRLENTRLLYVGATRAVRRLYLSATLTPEEDTEGVLPQRFRSPPEGSLLYPIWETFHAQMHVAVAQPQDTLHQASPPLLWRAEHLPPAPALPPSGTGLNRPEQPTNRWERIVGTVIHEQLEALSAAAELPKGVPGTMLDRVSLRLRELGLWGEQLDEAVSRLQADLTRTLADQDRGRWILSRSHHQARSEMPLAVCRDGKLGEIVIDRCFVDAETGLRWVIDYKSSLPPQGVSLAEFTRQEAERYREQLRVYRDALQSLGPEPVRCALYFTGLALFHVLAELDG